MTNHGTADPVDLPVSYQTSNETTSPKFAQAFARGCGGQLASTASGLLPGPFAAFCTPGVWPLLDQARAERRTYYYGDHAYYGRGKYYRITKNAAQYQPSITTLARTSRRRFAACGVNIARTWQTTGRSILVCPQTSAYMAHFAGADAAAWVEQVSTTLRQFTDRPIVTRTKAANHRGVSIYQSLTDAWAVVVFSSNAAIDALVAGVPVFVLAPWAAAAPMGRHDLTKIESPIYPAERELFLWSLANHQWRLDEIADGTAWKALNV